MQLLTISGQSFHDWNISGVEASERRWTIRAESGESSVSIVASDVVFAVMSDVLSRNIISEIGYLDIDRNSLRNVIDDLLGFNSQYFDSAEAQHYSLSELMIGKKYLAVSCSYGLSAGIVCEDISTLR